MNCHKLQHRKKKPKKKPQYLQSERAHSVIIRFYQKIRIVVLKWISFLKIQYSFLHTRRDSLE